MYDLSPSAIISRVKKLEATAKAKGISMKKICANANISYSTWQRWRNGDVSPRVDNLYAVEVEISRAIKRSGKKKRS